jgi:hypothetical protein
LETKVWLYKYLLYSYSFFYLWTMCYCV